MSSRYPPIPLERTTLFAIGQRLRVEYDAIQEPLPPRLAALLHHFEMRPKNGKPAQSASLLADRHTAHVLPMKRHKCAASRLGAKLVSNVLAMA
jgi:hypothetical protein